MDNMKNQLPVPLSGTQLRFIRCDRDGNEIPPETLAGMNFTNSTIDRLVTETAGRLGAVTGGDGIFSDGIVTS